MTKRAIVWFRRDLRLADNPALHAALDDAFESIVPVFIHAPEELGDWAPGGAQRVWLHESLQALSQSLAALGSRLIIRTGPSQQALDTLTTELQASAVFWNRLYDPQEIRRDTAIKKHLLDHGLRAESFQAHLLYEPWTVQTNQGSPYKVFTPFWKNVRDRPIDKPLPGPTSLPEVAPPIDSESIDALALLPDIRWDDGIRASWAPGEQGAHNRLESFLEGPAQHYDDSRNRPAQAGTSYLSPHLHWGEIGPRQIMHRLEEWLADHPAPAPQSPIDSFRSEIGWREFAHHVLFHFPATPDSPLDVRFEAFPWQNDAQALDCWQRATTGIPMIDAGMRELWHTGYMHNRVRMTVASFLTKNLRIAWQEGERWFWDTLVDADLANNTLGWQWAAGSGADAAPFFRIFNPVRQGERFDADGVYVRYWIPELARLDKRYIHKPWTAPADKLKAAGVRLGETYPQPIVDLKQSRQEALDAFSQIKSGG